MTSVSTYKYVQACTGKVCMQIAPISTHKHPKAPISTHKHPKAPKSTHKHPKAPKSTQKHPKAPIRGSHHLTMCINLHPIFPKKWKSKIPFSIFFARVDGHSRDFSRTENPPRGKKVSRPMHTITQHVKIKIYVIKYS